MTVKNYSSGVLFFCSYLLNEVINASDKIRHTNGEKPDGGKNLVSSNYQTFIVTLVEYLVHNLPPPPPHPLAILILSGGIRRLLIVFFKFSREKDISAQHVTNL